MLTNLLVTIVTMTVTNIETTTNGKTGCPFYSIPGVVCSVYGCDHTPTKQPTEKVETTTIKEITTLSFEWESQTYVAKKENVLSVKERRFKLKQEWEEQTSKELDVINYGTYFGDLVFTNYTIRNDSILVAPE